MPFSLKTLLLLQSTGASPALLADIIASVRLDFGDDAGEVAVMVERMSRTRRLRQLRPLSRSKREAIFERDGYKCHYCPCDDPVMMTVDHVVPMSKGGTHDPVNLVCACTACNGDKADMTVEEWQAKKAAALPTPSERKPYTLRELRKPAPLKPRKVYSFEAASVAEAERILKRDRANIARAPAL